MDKIKVGVLGATGMVGQTIVGMLDKHPWFEVTELAASERSMGKSYGELMRQRWNIAGPMPEFAKDMKVKECKPNLDCDLVFSALDSSVAHGIEEEFAKEGYAVSSNAKNHRMDKDVPLIIPEINPDHLKLVEAQKKRGWKGFIVTDPNCSTIGMCLALKPLMDRFGIEKVMVTTMQALSGAGYPGVASLDAVDNMIPYISGEEEKMESEPLKIFGRLEGENVTEAKMGISASCNRVAVRHGHTECVSVKLSKSASPEQIAEAMESFNPLGKMGLPTAPKRPVIVSEHQNRPQPKLSPGCRERDGRSCGEDKEVQHT